MAYAIPVESSQDLNEKVDYILAAQDSLKDAFADLKIQLEHASSEMDKLQ